MEKTYFIAFEGIDGCGKDTQLNKLVELIKEDDNGLFGNKYSNIWVTREPTRITKAGNEISDRLKGESVSKEDATNGFVEDRIEHSVIIRDMLKHSHVLTSRYDLSTLSYQMTQGMSFDELYDMHRYGEPEGCLIPDLTIVFNLDVQTAAQRMSGRNEDVECFENIEFQTKLKINLDYCIEELRRRDSRNILIIDASSPIEKVTQDMYKQIKETLKTN